MRKVPGVKVYPNESFDEAYRRFKKQTDRNLVVTEVRARRSFEPIAKRCLNVFTRYVATSHACSNLRGRGSLACGSAREF